MHYFSPLTPTVFLERSGRAYPSAPAVRDGRRTLGYGELLNRSRRLATALSALGVAHGDRVALLTDNCPEAIEANFGVPGAGAVLVSLNPWLPTAELAKQLAWVDCRVLLASVACLERHGAHALAEAGRLAVVAFGQGAGTASGAARLSYEQLLSAAEPTRALDACVENELDPIVINFTSGTTGTPKGVVMTHRGAYLHALGQVLMLGLGRDSRYLWTLPMFHVNGWGHVWANAVVGASQALVELPRSTAADRRTFCDFMRDASITHLAGAPRLLREIVALDDGAGALRGCTMVTGGAAPSRALLLRLEAVGARLIHQYGLNETFGPYVVCEEQSSWRGQDAASLASLRSRQGLPGIHAGSGLRVVGADGGDVPADGHTSGEVMMSGNTVALGYFGADDATARSFVDGWFRSGDLAVIHPDGYLEIKDRIKDLIYVETEYGWENVSAIEVERVLVECPGVTDAALIGVRASEAQASAELFAVIEASRECCPSVEQLRGFCEQRLPLHMRPHRFLFSDIPKTATGKCRKDVLVARALQELELPRVHVSPAAV